MARKPLHDRIAAHREKMARDKARLGQLEGRAKSANRKRDDRRKILIGAAVVGEIERDPEFRRRVMQLLHVALVRPIDREVLRDLLPEGSHPPAANSDGAPNSGAGTKLPEMAAEVARQSEAETRIATELEGLVEAHAPSETGIRRKAEG